MLYCRPDEPFTAHWLQGGLSHCFLESLTAILPLAYIVPASLAQWLYYRKYAAPSADYRRPYNCCYAAQVVLHFLFPFLSLLRLWLQYAWPAPPAPSPDPSGGGDGGAALFGYQVAVAVSGCASWTLAALLLRLERGHMLPSSPAKTHGLALLGVWTALLAGELAALVNFHSRHWWFALETASDRSETVFYAIRLAGSLLAFFVGLKAPGMAWVEDFLPYMVQNPLLPSSYYERQYPSSSESGSVSSPFAGATSGRATGAAIGAAAVGGSTWRGAVGKLRRLLPFLWPRSSRQLQLSVLIAFLLLLMSRAVNVFVPIYSKVIVNDLSASGAAVPWRDISVLVLLKLLMGGGVGTMGLLNNLRSLLWIQVQQYTEREVQVELFAHLHRLSLSWHLSRKTGEVLRVMDRGTASINTLLSYICFQIVPTFIDISVAVVFFSTQFNAWFGLIVLVTMLLYLAATIGITEWRTKYRRRANLLDNEQRAKGVDSLLNFETVKYYDAEQYEVHRYRQAVIDRQRVDWQSQASLNLLNCVQSVVICGGLFVGSALCAHMVLDTRQLTVGDYVLFATYMVQLYAPLNWFGTYYRMIQQNFIDMENMLELLQERQQVSDPVGAGPLQLRHGRLELRDVSFRYHPDRPVLSRVSFTVQPGHTVALVGPSGSGKSTIVRLLFRLYDPCQGQILLDNQDIRLLQQSSVRQAIGVVPQDTVLFNDTIRYNIRYGRRNATVHEVESAALSADLHDRIVRFPDQYDTQVGERGLKLSGGEKQRVAIARTLLKAPTFILLDEATSALDTETERNIQCSLRRVCAGRTTLIVAHRLSTIAHADLILVLKEGHIVERGRHNELLELDGVYASMWRRQSEAERKVSHTTADIGPPAQTETDAAAAGGAAAGVTQDFVITAGGGDSATGDAGGGDSATGDAGGGDSATGGSGGDSVNGGAGGGNTATGGAGGGDSATGDAGGGDSATGGAGGGDSATGGSGGDSVNGGSVNASASEDCPRETDAEPVAPPQPISSVRRSDGADDDARVSQ